MLRSPNRLIAPAALVTLALATSGCGGTAHGDADPGGAGRSASGQGGAEATYVKTYEAACEKILAQTKVLQADMAKLPSIGADDPEAAMAKVKQAMIAMMTTLGEQFQAMTDVEAPERFAAFQKQVVDNADRLSRNIVRGKALFAKLEGLEDFAKLRDQVTPASFAGGTPMPDELVDLAPSCREVREHQS